MSSIDYNEFFRPGFYQCKWKYSEIKDREVGCADLVSSVQ